MDKELENILKTEKIKEAIGRMDKDGSSLETELINISKTKQMIEAIKNMENDEDRPAKRKRIVLTLEDKKNVILEREKGSDN